VGFDIVTNTRRTCGAQTQYINCENSTLVSLMEGSGDESDVTRFQE